MENIQTGTTPNPETPAPQVEPPHSKYTKGYAIKWLVFGIVLAGGLYVLLTYFVPQWQA